MNTQPVIRAPKPTKRKMIDKENNCQNKFKTGEKENNHVYLTNSKFSTNSLEYKVSKKEYSRNSSLRNSEKENNTTFQKNPSNLNFDAPVEDFFAFKRNLQKHLTENQAKDEILSILTTNKKSNITFQNSMNMKENYKNSHPLRPKNPIYKNFADINLEYKECEHSLEVKFNETSILRKESENKIINTDEEYFTNSSLSFSSNNKSNVLVNKKLCTTCNSNNNIFNNICI